MPGRRGERSGGLRPRERIPPVNEDAENGRGNVVGRLNGKTWPRLERGECRERVSEAGTVGDLQAFCATIEWTGRVRQ